MSAAAASDADRTDRPAPSDRLAELRRLTLPLEPSSASPERERGRKRRHRIPVLPLAAGAFALGIAGALVATAVLSDGGRPVAAVRQVAGERSHPSPVAPATVVAAGYVVARRQATVAAEITGRITDIPVREGDIVRKGQILATLDDTLARADLVAQDYDRQGSKEEVNAADARLQNLRSIRDRTQSLRARGFATEASLVAAISDEMAAQAQAARSRSSLEAQKARAERLREQVGRFVVRAPFDGVVIERNAQVGEIISPISAGGGFTRTGLCTIADMTSLELEVDVAEAYLARVRAGQAASVAFDAYPQLRLPAKVAAVIPTISREKGTVKVRLQLLTNDSRILPNMSVKAYIVST